ncbi:hypothetical protein SCUP515_05217 [Seiridium cupressi]
MPTSTLSGWAFHNYGPLTTTYTAPASCFTEPTNIELGRSIKGSDNSSTLAIFGGTCAAPSSTGVSIGDCLPSGSEYDKAYAALDTNNPAAGFTIDYYSPGLFCPSGYETVGVASKTGGGSITSSGSAFVLPSAVTIRASGAYNLGRNPAPNVLLQGLNDGETAVICCPSSYTVSIAGYCWSPLPSYPVPTEACAREIPPEDVDYTTEVLSIFGTTITANVITYVSTSPITETHTEIFSTSEDWTAVTFAPFVTLIHNGADASQATTSSAASPGRAGGASGAGAVFSLWAAGLAAGILYAAFL